MNTVWAFITLALMALLIRAPNRNQMHSKDSTDAVKSTMSSEAKSTRLDS